ncbi:hypothetical protein [Marinobacter apostichopi]|uniref:hypothetical protein n=1 Tax=Marinobacter apostichopi TaxID=3035454 RepID=UPI00257343ED|nr:hypothetical protein [Marinobacter sp. LA51]
MSDPDLNPCLNRRVSPTLYSQCVRALVPVLMALLALGSGPASSAEALTGAQVQSFLASLNAAQALEPELEAIQDEMEASTMEGNTEAPDFARIFSETVRNMEGQPVYDRLEDIVQEHGFSDLQQWSQTGDRIFQAWMAIELQEQNPQAQQEIAEAMAEIENSPHMTETQKAQMRAMMEGAMGAMESAKNAPPADIEAIRPHLDELRAFSEAE